MIHQKKYEALKKYLSSLERVAVAYSGGVDSTFLLKVAVDLLGAENAIAITADAASFPKREMDEALSFCKENNIKQIIFDPDQLSIEGFRKNPRDRCYICKRRIFEKIRKMAADEGITAVIEGSNLDDMGDYRPGMRAIEELEILSPLKYAGMTKQDIRDLSREFGLPTWDKPSFACLATRFVYGETIDEKRLEMVDRAEQKLFDLGFRQFRVRVHGEGKGTMARIELDRADLSKAMEEDVRTAIITDFNDIGFTYVTLDMSGYRTGSMNVDTP